MGLTELYLVMIESYQASRVGMGLARSPLRSGRAEWIPTLTDVELK